MKKKRQHGLIRMYDYITKEEFEKHRKEMEDKGYRLIDGIMGGYLDAQEMDDDTWKYTACFLKSDMY